MCTLLSILQYVKLQNFKNIFDKVIVICENFEISTETCFPDASMTIISMKGKQDLINDYILFAKVENTRMCIVN